MAVWPRGATEGSTGQMQSGNSSSARSAWRVWAGCLTGLLLAVSALSAARIRAIAAAADCTDPAAGPGVTIGIGVAASNGRTTTDAMSDAVLYADGNAGHDRRVHIA